MKYAFVTLALSCLVAVAGAQWQRRFGGDSLDRGTAVRQTIDGGYIAAGFTSSFGTGKQDVYLVRTDSFGDTLWTRCYGGAGRDWGVDMCPTADSGFVVAGTTTSFGSQNYQFYLIRIDSRGDTLWTRTYPGINGAMCEAICPSIDGGWVLAGVEYTDSSTGARLVSVADNGDTVWTRTYVLAKGASADCIMPVESGGYIVAGLVVTDTTWDLLLMRTNDSGDTLWTRTFGGAGSEGAHGVGVTGNGGFVVAGYTDSYGAGGNDVYVIRTDSAGETLWTRTFGGPGNDIGWAVVTTSDGGFAVATRLVDSGQCLIRLDSAGTPLWTLGYGGTHAMVAYDLRETSDHGFILTGESDSDLALVKTDSAGNASALEQNHQPQLVSRKQVATVIHGVLHLPEASSRKPQAACLMDAAGRNVAELHAGANDVSRLAPGVYFVREPSAVSRKPSAVTVRKVVVER